MTCRVYVRARLPARDVGLSAQKQAYHRENPWGAGRAETMQAIDVSLPDALYSGDARGNKWHEDPILLSQPHL